MCCCNVGWFWGGGLSRSRTIILWVSSAVSPTTEAETQLQPPIFFNLPPIGLWIILQWWIQIHDVKIKPNS